MGRGVACDHQMEVHVTVTGMYGPKEATNEMHEVEFFAFPILEEH
jgi:hypothetical protein